MEQIEINEFERYLLKSSITAWGEGQHVRFTTEYTHVALQNQPMVAWNSCEVGLATAQKCNSEGKDLVKKERGCIFKGYTELE